MTAKRPVVFIGLDSGDATLIEKWAREGRLPWFARLLARGRVMSTRGPEGVYVGALWPSAYTASEPGNHGCYCWEQLKPGTYEIERFHIGKRIEEETFWDHLSRCGKRVAVVDMPLCRDTRNINGIQINEWGTHNHELGPSISPRERAEEIRSQVAPYPFARPCNAHRRTAEEFATFRDQLVDGVRAKSALNRHLLRDKPWDLFVTVYGETHCIGHQCWHLHDPVTAGTDAELARAVGDPVFDVYRALDEELAGLEGELDDDAIFVLFASHGMGPRRGATHMFDEILKRLEVADRLTWARRWASLLELAARAPIPVLRAYFAATRDRAAGKVAAKTEQMMRNMDRPDRLYFQVPNHHPEAALRWNLRGREPSGKVRRQDIRRMQRRLTKDLLALRDPETGGPVVSHCSDLHAFHCGKLQDQLPDLACAWQGTRLLKSVFSPKAGYIHGWPDTCRSGDHFPGGLLVVAGAGIAPARLSGDARVTDIFPTICEWLGAPWRGVDGRPLGELLPP